MKATLVLLVALATLCTLALLSDGLAIDEVRALAMRVRVALAVLRYATIRYG